MSAHPRRITRALLSVSDKTGLIDFARALAGYGIELISTGGTAKALKDAGLKVIDVAELTGFPEMMDGRVKTLHPKVHGGLLAIRDDKRHAAAMEKHGIRPIDLLVVNLYPFEATVAKGAPFADCIENIDIGGPAMIRAAAKNHADVAVVVEPADYGKVLAELREIRLDFTRLSDELSNITKFFGFWHLARIYAHLCELFGLSHWQKVLDEKLKKTSFE